VAILGAAPTSERHAGPFQASGKAEVVAVASRTRERMLAFADKFKIPGRYQDLSELLAKEKPDLVSICSPTAFHYEQILACLRAGANVLCEKPIAGSLEQLDGIRKVEQETGRWCSSIFQWRYGSGMGHLRKLARDGALGRLLLGICHTLWYRDMVYYSNNFKGKWQTEQGGASVTLGIHALDAFLWVVGDWAEVRAEYGTVNHDIEVDDVAVAAIRLECGARASLVNSSCSPRQETYLRWDFQKAGVELRSHYEYHNRDWTVTPADPKDPEPLRRWQTLNEDLPNLQATQIAELLGQLERGKRPATDVNEARRSIEFLSAFYLSAESGRAVKRGGIEPGSRFYRSLSGHPDAKQRAGA
jgi:predicted dehydrogenase